MSALELLAVLAAGFGAGLINAIAGSGSLLTFPVLLALGVPPVTANTSNGVGLAPGGFAAAWGMREELRGQGRRVAVFAAFSGTGAAAGALLLLILPPSVFAVVVPVLIAVGVVLVALGPWFARRRAAREARAEEAASTGDGIGMRLAAGATGVYGGYFGAAQGILLVAILGTRLPDPLHRLNAIKNVLAGVANAVSAVIFISLSPFLEDGAVDPLIAGTIAVGATVGALVGARVAGRIPASALRAVLIVVGLVAIVGELR